MTLYIKQQGQGFPLILLHGWGFNHAIWEDCAAQWARYFTVYQVDLPGHGQSPLCDYDWERLLPVLAAQLPARAIWVGWSLGGLLASAMARWRPERVQALVLFASSPCFMTADDWPHAMTPQVLNQFAHQLAQDIEGTLQRFLLLQVRGLDAPRQKLRQLQPLVAQAGYPSLATLQQGLTLLINSDLRKELAAISCPALLFLGHYDALVPVAVRHDIAKWWPTLKTVVVKPAAHLPFLSHFEIIDPIMRSFLLPESKFTELQHLQN
ncbi:pimeloyl-ACP methyl ester esterase BioH [Thioflexithrix psekupsensis]|uniref:Pimeloyl-[acyl-carrier protein] methyl ester esterase n=1 Tax=Thioflexithrix psekupsensis TaxID=1570016 RepID=A0A251X9I3_9GAMM|nr:pimeloyl-ACP methyl ester esterase BioH [Thioflexithrix psekupsensis]OUD14162.1 pimeloyl-[acyl-carrier protein] methyl ester esterase [Thioflexithrix psekupsensis]